MLNDYLQQIDQAKARLDAYRPLPAHTAASLREHITLEWTYNSNGIEGNTLTLRETKVVLEGITVGGKKMQEHLEAVNHRDAIEFLEQLVGNPAPVTERDIKDMHSIILRGIAPQDAGRYRHENVIISGASTFPPDFLHVEESMQSLLSSYHGNLEEHPIKRAAQLHTRFVKIHPFVDGNGRTGRLLMNLELMKCGYPPAIIRVGDRLSYYDALDNACVNGDFDGITYLIADGVQRSLALYLEVIEPQPLPTGPLK